jgi:hypothetical protein
VARARGFRNGSKQDHSTSLYVLILHISDDCRPKYSWRISLTRAHASPHRPSPTPKASRTTFPTSSAVDAYQTSPVPASVAHFQSPGESACRSLEMGESNPLEVEQKDRATLVSRIQHVYQKAVIRMRFYGKIWHVPCLFS